MPIDPNWDPYDSDNLNLPEDEYLAHFTEEEIEDMQKYEEVIPNQNLLEDPDYWRDVYAGK